MSKDRAGAPLGLRKLYILVGLEPSSVYVCEKQQGSDIL